MYLTSNYEIVQVHSPEIKSFMLDVIVNLFQIRHIFKKKENSSTWSCFCILDLGKNKYIKVLYIAQNENGKPNCKEFCAQFEVYLSLEQFIQHEPLFFSTVPKHYVLIIYYYQQGIVLIITNFYYILTFLLFA